MKSNEQIKEERNVVAIHLKTAPVYLQHYGHLNAIEKTTMFLRAWELLTPNAQWVVTSPHMRDFLSKRLNLATHGFPARIGMEYIGTLDKFDYYEDPLFPKDTILIGRVGKPAMRGTTAQAKIVIKDKGLPMASGVKGRVFFVKDNT